MSDRLYRYLRALATCPRLAGILLLGSIMLAATAAGAAASVDAPVGELSVGDLLSMVGTAGGGSPMPWVVILVIAHQMIGVLKRAEEIADRGVGAAENLVERGITHHHIRDRDTGGAEG